MSIAYDLADLSFSYGDTEVLTLDQLRIAGNKVSALVGPNGAGKSTLMHLLAFVESPTRGTIRFFGDTIVDTPVATRRRVALVPQEPYLLNASVFQNVEIGLKLRGMPGTQRKARAEDTLVQLGLMRFRDRPAADLSGGEQQKLAIGRALVLEPEVLLLDEPFSHLDDRTNAELRALITRIGAGSAQTVLFTTHNLGLAHELAAEVHALVAGRQQGGSLLNLYHGRLDQSRGVFDTGRILIPAPQLSGSGDLLSIDPQEILLARADDTAPEAGNMDALVTGMQSLNKQVCITLDVGGETLQVLRPDAKLLDKPLALGDKLRITTTSDALRIF